MRPSPMPAPTFFEADLVLGVAGQVMTVLTVDDSKQSCNCVWYTATERHTADFPFADLKLLVPSPHRPS